MANYSYLLSLYHEGHCNHTIHMQNYLLMQDRLVTSPMGPIIIINGCIMYCDPHV